MASGWERKGGGGEREGGLDTETNLKYNVYIRRDKQKHTSGDGPREMLQVNQQCRRF